jgi:hypothetical protein
MRTTVWWCSAVQDMHLSQCVTRLCCYSGFTKDASVTPDVPCLPTCDRYKQLEADGDEDDADLVEQVSAQLSERDQRRNTVPLRSVVWLCAGRRYYCACAVYIT